MEIAMEASMDELVKKLGYDSLNSLVEKLELGHLSGELNDAETEDLMDDAAVVIKHLRADLGDERHANQWCPREVIVDTAEKCVAIAEAAIGSITGDDLRKHIEKVKSEFSI